MATDESHGQKTLYPWAGIQGPSRDPAPCFLSTFSLIFHTIPVFQRTEVTGQTHSSDLGLSVCLRAESDESGRHRAPPSPRHTLSPVIDFTLRPTGIEVPPGPSDGRARGARSPWAEARSPAPSWKPLLGALAASFLQTSPVSCPPAPRLPAWFSSSCFLHSSLLPGFDVYPCATFILTMGRHRVAAARTCRPASGPGAPPGPSRPRGLREVSPGPRSEMGPRRNRGVTPNSVLSLHSGSVDGIVSAPGSPTGLRALTPAPG